MNVLFNVMQLDPTCLLHNLGIGEIKIVRIFNSLSHCVPDILRSYVWIIMKFDTYNMQTCVCKMIYSYAKINSLTI